MSRFIKEITIETTFEGDKVKAVFRPADVADFITFSGVKKTDKEAIAKMAFEMLPKYLVSLEGLKDNQGNALAGDEVFGKVYFMKLISDWMKKWLEDSQPKKLN